MVQRLINAFWYAGVDQTSYEMVKPRIRNTNRTMTIVLSSFASILILAMLLSSFKSTSVDQNRVVYEAGFILSIAIFIIACTLARKFTALVTPLVYVSYAIYYIYGIMIGTITDPTSKTVTFMVFLAFLPTLFIDRPIHSIIITTFYVMLFMVLCLANKTGEVLSVDLMDAIIFAILGVASGVVINHMKVRGYVSEYKLQQICRIDQLTGMQNQNAFKIDMVGVSQRFHHSLACVYFDVNGLHDLNNEKGHAEGDKMLQFIGKLMMNYYGEDKTYRIGGDEFVAFVPDIDQEDLVDKISDTIEAIEREGYSIAVGYEIANSHHIVIEDVIKSADLRMQDDKKHYKSRN